MSKRAGWAVTWVAAAMMAGLFCAFFPGCRERAGEEEGEHPVKAPSRVATVEGRTTVRMPPAEAARNGIGVSVLQGVVRRREARVPAMVLSGEELTGLRTSYVAATARLQKTRAALATSRPEYERLSTLYEKERNASLTALQAARGTMTADEAAAGAARDSLLLAESGMRQRWGTVVAGWVIAGSPEFQRLTDQKDLLVQVTPPVGTKPPASVGLDISSRPVEARFISPLPRLDPRVQAQGYLYVVPYTPGLVPGMNLVAFVPSGPPERGVFVPASAVVWRQGRAWVYVQERGGFVQRVLTTDFGIENGFIALSGFEPGERVVTRGAQQLLSEVFRSQIRTGEEGR